MNQKQWMIKILMPLPTLGSDPSEVAIPWSELQKQGMEVVFATPDGRQANVDPVMLTGKGLGWFKGVLKAREDAVAAYRELEQTEAFKTPIAYSAITPEDYEGVFLAGGHDKTVKEYLESIVLQEAIVSFFTSKKIIGAVCHGVVLVARSIDPNTHKSVLHTYQTTALLKTQELLGYRLSKFWKQDYYLTYPGCTVEDEVKSVLKNQRQFMHGPQPIFRDREGIEKHGFAVRDRNYISARWPGDIYTLSSGFISMLKEK